ncbi:unnamed protein product [Lupinus luteus]|uniref:Uncharacterized protein n=1 Tax=Lupinus luteus TaxID=3873 RepID=A0AAV1WBL2_LUPLU
MYCLWIKLKRLQPSLRLLGKNNNAITDKIQEARENLVKAQYNLQANKFNPAILLEVKGHIDALMHLHMVEEQILQQKYIINWLQLGDANNSFFYATVKDK